MALQLRPAPATASGSRLSQRRASRACVRVLASNYADAVLPGVAPLPPPPGDWKISTYDTREVEVDVCVPGQKLNHENKRPVGPVSVHAAGQGKALINTACDELRLPRERRALYMSLAMQESSNLDAKMRDGSKDFDGNAANVGMFNLSVDLVQRSGKFGDNLSFAQWQVLNGNDVPGVKAAIEVMEKAIPIVGGIPQLIAYVRGGWSGWQQPDNPTYRVHEYVSAIRTYLELIDANEALLTNNERPDIDVSYLDTGAPK